jgi:hypothetical protein
MKGVTMTDKLTVKRHKRGKPYMGDDYSEFWSEVLQERDILKKKVAIATKALEIFKDEGSVLAITALNEMDKAKIDKTGPKP